jgi:cell division protease FtsH
MMDKQQFSLWYFIGVLVLLFAVQTYFGGEHAETLSYSDFKTLLQAGKVRDVTIGSDTIRASIDLTGTDKLLPAAEYNEMKQAQETQAQQGASQGFFQGLFSQAPSSQVPSSQGATGPAAKSGSATMSLPAATNQALLHPVVARRVEDPQLTAQLDAAKVRYTAAAENRWLSTLLSWVLPAVIFVGVWSFMMRRAGGGQMGGMMEVGKSKAKVYVQKNLDVKFADVAGIDEAKEELMEVEYNEERPKRVLGGRTPAEYAKYLAIKAVTMPEDSKALRY